MVARSALPSAALILGIFGMVPGRKMPWSLSVRAVRKFSSTVAVADNFMRSTYDSFCRSFWDALT